LRYLDPKNDEAFLSSEKEKYWMNVDLYVGGAEHAVLHLLYARFWHKALYDLGFVSTAEPFQKLVNQGIILGEDGQKMSKSRGNVINPDQVIDRYGADTLRLYEMFVGPLEQSKAWSTQGVEGVFRFLGRVWRLFVNEQGTVRADIRDQEPPLEEKRLEHRLIKKVSQDFERMAFNTAISAFMIFVNEEKKFKVKSKKTLQTFLTLLSPMAPHLAEELWEKLGHDQCIVTEKWPSWKEEWLTDENIEIAIQINGKVRSHMTVSSSLSQEELKAQALKDIKVAQAVNSQKIRKVIVVPKRLVNVVVGS